MKFDRQKIEICRRLAERIAASMHQKMKLAEALRQVYESKLMLEAVDIVDSSENLIAALTELSGKIIELEYVSFCRIFLTRMVTWSPVQLWHRQPLLLKVLFMIHFILQHQIRALL